MAHDAQVAARDGAADLQRLDVQGGTLDAAHVVAAQPVGAHRHLQAQFLAQGVRLGQRHLDHVIAVHLVLAHDVVGILCPLLTVEFHVRLGYVDLEVPGQRGEGVSCQLRHAVGLDGDARQTLAAVEGVAAYRLEGVGQ